MRNRVWDDFDTRISNSPGKDYPLSPDRGPGLRHCIKPGPQRSNQLQEKYMGSEVLFESIEPADPPEDENGPAVDFHPEGEPELQLIAAIEILTSAVREQTAVLRRLDSVVVLPKKP